MIEETEKLLKEIKECDSLHNNCDYLLEHSDCDLLIEYVERLEKTVCDFSLDNVKLNDYQLILSRENTQLKSVLKEIREKINFYKTTEWGLRGYSILETFEEIIDKGIGEEKNENNN